MVLFPCRLNWYAAQLISCPILILVTISHASVSTGISLFLRYWWRAKEFSSVTVGDFARPLAIMHFVNSLHSGLQLLNLKNDSLRKRFDAVKYDVKKIEEVVYDVKVRGLLPNQ